MAVGNQPLIGLDGHLLSPGDAAGKVLLAWVCVLAPTLALAAIGLLGSVALGRSPMGLLLPAVVALGDAARPDAAAARRRPPRAARLRLHLLERPVHQPGTARPAADRHRGQPGVGRRRDRAGLPALRAARLHQPGPRRLRPPRDHRRRCCRWSDCSASRSAVVAAATGATGSGIDQDKVQRSVATAFAHLYRLQTKQLNRPDVTEAQLQTTAAVHQGRRPGRRRRGRATTGAASSPGTSPASRPPGRPSTSSTSPRTGGTSPTATDRRK